MSNKYHSSFDQRLDAQQNSQIECCDVAMVLRCARVGVRAASLCEELLSCNGRIFRIGCARNRILAAPARPLS
jgi:hypothetical protein